jgi:hypothetical protein
LRKPKKEPTPAASLDIEDDAILEAVLARSKDDIIPAEFPTPLDAALALSMAEWEKEVVER